MKRFISHRVGELEKKLSLAQFEKLKPFVKTKEDADLLAAMNRKERRKFYAQNKKRLKFV